MPTATKPKYINTLKEYARSLKGSDNLYPMNDMKLLHLAIEAAIALFGEKLSSEMSNSDVQIFSKAFKITDPQTSALLTMAAVIRVSFLLQWRPPV